MRFFHSLQFKLSALVLIFGAVLIAFGVTQQWRRDIDRQLQTRREGAMSACTRLAGLSEHVFRRNLSSTLDLDLSYKAAQREMRLSAVVDHRNRMLHATARDWQGRQIEESPLREAMGAAARARETMSSILEETDSSIIAVAPFLMGREMRDRGVVVMAHDKQDVITSAKNKAMEEAIRFSVFLLGACLMLWVALNTLVTERVQKVVQQTEGAAVEEGRFEPLQGKDEFSLMSRAFYNSLRIRQELWQSQQPLWKLVEELKDVFWSASLTAKQSWYVNPAYEKVWGLKIADLKQNRLDWMRVLSKSDRRRAVAAMRELIKGGAVEDLRLKVHAAAGARRVLCRSFAVVGKDGGIISIAGLVMDVTEGHAVSRRLAEASEQERRRIGWDLHDNLCQRLVGALFKCNSMLAAAKRDEPPQTERLAQIAEEISETTQFARALARGLAPVLEGGSEVEEALEQLAIFLNRSFATRCETALDPRLPSLRAEAATHLYRIAQELAMNAVKHGKATQVEILFWREEENLQLQVRSNGAPFHGVAASQGKKGMGMHMIRQRLDILGAQIHFKAARPDDPWNLVVCEVPLEEVEALAGDADDDGDEKPFAESRESGFI